LNGFQGLRDTGISFWKGIMAAPKRIVLSRKGFDSTK